MIEIKPIHSEVDYEEALAEVSRLMDAEAKMELGAEDFARLDILATLVQSYEKEKYPMRRPHPIDAIESHLERLSLSLKDVAPLFGGIARAEAVMQRERRLTLPIIWRLNEALQIPVETLAQKYPLRKARPKPSEKAVVAAAG